MSLFPNFSIGPSPTFSQGTLRAADNASPDDATSSLPVSVKEESSSMGSPPAPIVRRKFDPDFYFNGVFVVFEVEGCLFRVPIYIFTNESENFANLFNLHILDPECASTTVVLPVEIRREDFRNFLKALYPISVETKLSLSELEWISVLKLSTKWSFINLRKIAISELESLQSLPSLTKIVLGRLCFVSSWLIFGLTEIVDRTEPINTDDAIAIGLTTTVKLFTLREVRMQNRHNDFQWRYYSSSTSMEAVRSAFAAELLSVQTEEQILQYRPILPVDKDTWLALNPEGHRDGHIAMGGGKKKGRKK